MGSGDEEASTKSSKSPPTQEQPPATTAPPVYPDWTAFQAYSPMPPHGFFHPSVGATPPYMWGPQHLMPPYGTPPPYVAMYPPGGMYSHPSVPPGSHPFSPYAMPPVNGNAEVSSGPGAVEADGKSSDKEKSPLKRSKGSLGSLNMLTGKNNNEQSKISVPSANGGVSHSAESATDGSSEGSDANSQNDSQPKDCPDQNSLEGEASQNGSATHDSNDGIPHTSQHAVLNPTMAIMPVGPAGYPGGVPGPTTSLNIGMDYWGTPTQAAMPAIRGKVPSTPVAGAVVPHGLGGSREIGQQDLWVQDERELKRQRRKQSNRESARRSRLRKQAECEELAQRVEVLKEENSTLKSEVTRIKNEYEQLVSKNTSLKERLGEIPIGHDGMNDQHTNHDDQQAGQTDQVQISN